MAVARIVWCALLVNVIFMTAGADADPDSEVKIGDGTLIPAMRQSRAGQLYRAYLGIPYAEPPVGDLRFQAPVQAKGWTGPRNATELKPICLHYNPFAYPAPMLEGEEDCLYLNVFVPGVQKPNTSLPVMVFFHNGAYMWGSGIFYGGAYFMDEPVILVTSNWRISLLGFLNAGIPEAQGNQGLKDQVMVLKWVQEHIGEFGGDAKLVTIFGDLAGGASVHYHMYSPMSKGLFSGGISQGGSVLCPWGYDVKPRVTLKKVASFLDIPYRNKTAFVESLKKMDAKTFLNETIPNLFEWDSAPINLFGPSAEIVGNAESKFLDTTPYKFLQKLPVNNVPWIQGANEDLGLLAADGIATSKELTEGINKDWETIAPLYLFFRETAMDRTAVSKALKKEYFGDKRIDNATLRQLSDLMSHRTFTYGNRRSIISHLEQTKEDPKPVYLYHFNKECKSSILGGATQHGPTEGDELQFLFNTTFPFFRTIGKDDTDFEFSKEFIRLWIHFATYRNTAYKWNGIQDLKWEPVNRTEILEDPQRKFPIYLNINDMPTLSAEPFNHNVKFWDSLPLNENENELPVEP